MASTFTTNKSIEKPAYNDDASNPTGWSVPVNTDWDIIDRSLGGVQVMNPTGVSGSVTLTTAQYQAPIIVIGTSISGVATLTANVAYLIPSGIGGVWTIFNNTTGAFTVTIGNVAGGDSVVVGQGFHTIVYSDGTNIRQASNVTFVPGVNGQLVYNGAGSFAASSGMTWDGTTLTANALSATTTIASGGNLTVGGAITAAGNITAFSDRSLKKEVRTIEDALGMVLRMRGVTFEMINTGQHSIGVIAQELQAVTPQLVQDNNGLLSVAYGNLTAVLIEAVKELVARVDVLEAK